LALLGNLWFLTFVFNLKAFFK